MNDLFRDSYRRARERSIQADPVVVEVLGSFMRLYRNGQLADEQVVTAQDWRVLRVVAHIPLGIYVALTGRTGHTLPPEASAELTAYSQQIKLVEEALAGVDLTAEDRARQQQILDGSTSFLEAALGDGQVTEAQLQALAREQGPLILSNAQVASQSQIDAMHATLRVWLDRMTPAERNAVRFVIRAGQQPRRGHVAVTYFSQVVGQDSQLCYPMEGGRIVYAEDLFGPSTSIDLLSTLDVDRTASLAFFGDAERLSTDILAEGAREYAATVLAQNAPLMVHVGPSESPD